ncbi:MAG: hypothetical protein K6E50_03450 [Lachnospiraceae bacterium]|nr:hypothetical protein [Lachnospiraceae bacterium]
MSDPYWTSDERATNEAVNEANDVVGMEELQQAIEDGFTHKIWKTENDARVRKTHRAVEGKKIPIRDMFEVGNGLMRYPHDWYYNPKECYNCRCALVFVDKDGKVNKTDEKVQYTSEENSGILRYEEESSLLSRFDRRASETFGGFLSNNRGGAISNEEQQRRARIEIRNRIDSGRYSLRLQKQKYLEHVEGTPQYKITTAVRKGREPSRLTISYDETQQLIDELSATGRIEISRFGIPGDVEYITLDHTIGDIFVNGEWKPTKRIAIHHGNEGSHIVPVRENPKYG